MGKQKKRRRRTDHCFSPNSTTKESSRLLAEKKYTWTLISNTGKVTIDTWTPIVEVAVVAADVVAVVVVAVVAMVAVMVVMRLQGTTRLWKVEDSEEDSAAALLTILESHWRMMQSSRLCIN